MSKNIELIKKYNEGFANKDMQAVRALLNDDFTFNGPMMQFNSPDEMIAGLQNCPFEASHALKHIIEQDNHVVQIFDWVVTAPFEASIEMCEHLQIKDNTIIAGNLYFDTAKMPADAMGNAQCSTVEK